MRVVIVRLSALGDIIHTWPLAVALRRADPHIHLSWVVEEPFRRSADLQGTGADALLQSVRGKDKVVGFPVAVVVETVADFRLRENLEVAGA